MSIKTTNPLSGHSEGQSQNTFFPLKTTMTNIADTVNLLNQNTIETPEDFKGFELDKAPTPTKSCDISYYAEKTARVQIKTLDDIVNIIKDDNNIMGKGYETLNAISSYLWYKVTNNSDINNTLRNYFSKKDKDFRDLAILKRTYQGYKDMYPGFSPNIFSPTRASDNITHIPYVAMYDLDVFDSLEQREEKFIQITQGYYSRYVVLCYRTGKGLRLLVRILATNVENYKAVYNDFKEYVINGIDKITNKITKETKEETNDDGWNLITDEKAEDLARFSGLFHDPNVFVNYDSHGWRCRDESVYGEGFLKNKRDTKVAHDGTCANVSDNLIRTFIQKQIKRIGWLSGRNDCAFKVGSLCNLNGFDFKTTTTIFNEILLHELDYDDQTEYNEFSDCFARPYEKYSDEFADNRFYFPDYVKDVEELEDVTAPIKLTSEIKSSVLSINEKHSITTQHISETEGLSEALSTWISKIRRGALIAGTGMGKTTEVINYCLNNFNKLQSRQCFAVIAPTVLLTTQIFSKFEKECQDKDITLILGIGADGSRRKKAEWLREFESCKDTKNRKPFIFVGTPDQLDNLYNRFITIDREGERINVDTMFIDEIHTMYSHTDFRAKIGVLEKFMYTNTKMIAMTGTPPRFLTVDFDNTFTVEYSDEYKDKAEYNVTIKGELSLANIIKECNESKKAGRKVIVGIESIAIGKQLREKLASVGKVILLNSKETGTEDYKKFLATEEIDGDFLICTSALQDGFSIKDKCQVDIIYAYFRCGTKLDVKKARQLAARVRYDERVGPNNKSVNVILYAPKKPFAKKGKGVADDKTFVEKNSDSLKNIDFYSQELTLAKKDQIRVNKVIEENIEGGIRNLNPDKTLLRRVNSDGTLKLMSIANIAEQDFLRCQTYKFFTNTVNEVFGTIAVEEVTIEDKLEKGLDESLKDDSKKLNALRIENTVKIWDVCKKESTVERLFQLLKSVNPKLKSEVYNKEVKSVDKLTKLKGLVLHSQAEVWFIRLETIRSMYNPETHELYTHDEAYAILMENQANSDYGYWKKAHTAKIHLEMGNSSNNAKQASLDKTMEHVKFINDIYKMCKESNYDFTIDILCNVVNKQIGETLYNKDTMSDLLKMYFNATKDARKKVLNTTTGKRDNTPQTWTLEELIITEGNHKQIFKSKLTLKKEQLERLVKQYYYR